ncbi:hypothetical protein ACROYT_G035130 [Oculina patagonica]
MRIMTTPTGLSRIGRRSSSSNNNNSSRSIRGNSNGSRSRGRGSSNSIRGSSISSSSSKSSGSSSKSSGSSRGRCHPAVTLLLLLPLMLLLLPLLLLLLCCCCYPLCSNSIRGSSGCRSCGSSNSIRGSNNSRYRSCAEIKGAHKESKSGNYMITVKDKMLQVFCDMDNHGGGWTLVASISSSNRNHLIEGEHNCFNSGICVPYEDMDSLPSRKIKDEDIRWMASAYHGAFRVDVLRPSSNYSVFYAIPRGGEHFNSACTGGKGGSCPRIIISHSYPYQWESNCKGIDKGYLTGDSCHRVFDGHDNRECGSMWFSSKYDTNRILYGYCQSNGIYRNLQGRLFVK